MVRCGSARSDSAAHGFDLSHAAERAMVIMEYVVRGTRDGEDGREAKQVHRSNRQGIAPDDVEQHARHPGNDDARDERWERLSTDGGDRGKRPNGHRARKALNETEGYVGEAEEMRIAQNIQTGRGDDAVRDEPIANRAERRRHVGEAPEGDRDREDYHRGRNRQKHAMA